MNRKEFIAVVISAALGLSGAPVYASESAAFSDGEVQEYGAEEEKQEFQTDSQDPETDTFQDEVNQMQIQTDLWMRQQKHPQVQRNRMRMDLHMNILKSLIHTA